jgi:tetratricopeptide (TPR) repeat protein
MKKKILNIMIVFSLVTPSFSWAQVQSIPSSVGQVKDEQDVETLLNTMNEVLEENRKMRKEIETAEEELSKYSRENGGLKTQLNRLQRKFREADTSEKSRLVDAEKAVKKLEKELQEMRLQNEELSALKKYHEEKMPELIQESGKLKQLLETAVLEGEREEYLTLIENAQAMAQQSYRELSATKMQMKDLEAATADAHYKLGNVLFDMKDFENAIQSYELALQSRPNDAWVHHNLGIIYDYYIHDDKRAAYHFNEYLRLKPVTEEALEIRERLLEMELKKNMIPDGPMSEDFYANYVKEVR